MRKTKEIWIKEQCQDIEESLQRNNNRKAYQLAKDLTSTKQGRTTAIQDKEGICLTEDRDLLKRWTEYLYSHKPTGDPDVLNVPPATNTDNYLIWKK